MADAGVLHQHNSGSSQPDVLPKQYEVGCWVLVQYDGQLYPGQVCVQKVSFIQVHCVRRAQIGTKVGITDFVRPKREDKIFYSITDVIRNL